MNVFLIDQILKDENLPNVRGLSFLFLYFDRNRKTFKKKFKVLKAFNFSELPWFSVKESACNEGDMSSIPGWGRCHREGNGNALPYSFLGNPMDRGAWRATVHGVPRVGQDLVTKPLPTRRAFFLSVKSL